GTVTGAETDLGNMHLDHLLAVVGTAPRMELATTRALIAVQDGLDVLDRFFGQVIQLQEDGPVAALQLLVELPHHLAAPVVALDEALALVVGGKAAER